MKKYGKGKATVIHKYPPWQKYYSLWQKCSFERENINVGFSSKAEGYKREDRNMIGSWIYDKKLPTRWSDTNAGGEAAR